MFAIPGTLIACAMTTLLFWLCNELKLFYKSFNIFESFAFASIIAATDTVAV